MVLFNRWNGKWTRWDKRCKQWLRIMLRRPIMQMMHTCFLKVRLSRTTKPSQLSMSKRTKILSPSFITSLLKLPKLSSLPTRTLRWKMSRKSTQALAGTMCQYRHSWTTKQACTLVKCMIVRVQLNSKKMTKLRLTWAKTTQWRSILSNLSWKATWIPNLSSTTC